MKDFLINIALLSLVTIGFGFAVMVAFYTANQSFMLLGV